MFRNALSCVLGLMLSVGSYLALVPTVTAQMQPAEPALPSAINGNASKEVAKIYEQAEGPQHLSPSNGFLVANGFAKYVELENDIYIGALYLGTFSTDPSTIRNTEAKRMELKIVPSRLPYKRFGQLLIKSSAINNPPSALVENAEAMEEFLHVFRGNLVQGDHIVFANEIGGFSVLINGIELAKIQSDKLFNMLLNIWIGSVPPSRDFRTRILGGENSKEYESDFLSLHYGARRMAEIASWKMHQDVLDDVEREQVALAKGEQIGSEASIRLANANSPGQNTASVKQKTPAATPPLKPKKALLSAPPANVVEKRQVLANAQRAKKTAEKAPPETTDRADAREVPAKITVDDFDDGSSLLDDIKPGQLTPETEAEKITKSVLAKAADTTPKNAVLLDSTEQKSSAARSEKNAEIRTREKSFSAESLLAVQLYANKLLAHSQRQMQYPKMARRLRQEGKVVASVTVNRGGKLVKFELTDSSKYKTLNSAVEKGIKRSEPYPEIPELIDGEEFTFSVPVNFRYSG